jgi:RNA polymerase sigma factor (sigma-70 family)
MITSKVIMLNLEQSAELIATYVSLKNSSKTDPSQRKAFLAHEKLCIEKYAYIVDMKANHYRKFPNYEDLRQEGMLGLVKALQTFSHVSGGNFFYWAHRYIDTRITRASSKHSTMRIPMKTAKITPPKKEAKMPTILEKYNLPDKIAEESSMVKRISSSLDSLDGLQGKIIAMAYGVNGEEKVSLETISKKLGMKRIEVSRQIKAGFGELRGKIDN